MQPFGVVPLIQDGDYTLFGKSTSNIFKFKNNISLYLGIFVFN